jgi:hypothetical protein
MRIREIVAVLVAATAIVLASLPEEASAAAPSPAPAWSVEAVAYPTDFTPGTLGTKDIAPGYLVTATNLGAKATSGTFTITDVLPAGITPKKPTFAVYGKAPHDLLCEVVAVQTVTCSGSEPLLPGEIAQIRIPVQVAAGTPEFLTSEVTAGGGGAVSTSVSQETKVSPEPAQFDFLPGAPGLAIASVLEDGSAATQAGSHPYQLSVRVGLPSFVAPNKEILATGGGVRDVEAELPRGFVVNPEVTAKKCTEVQLESDSCPDESQIGLANYTISIGLPERGTRPLYNMVAAPGTPGEVGFEVVEGIYVHLQGSLRSDGDYGISAGANDILAKIAVEGVETILWGNPTDQSHDAMRGKCLDPKFPGPCTVERRDGALLTQPGSCSGPQTLRARMASWIEPGVFKERTTQVGDLAGDPTTISGCNQLEFDPTLAARPTTDAADSPTGLDVGLHQPQNNDYEGLATAILKDITVNLPAGAASNPSAANGRAACSQEQIGYQPGAGGEIHFSKAPQSCPDAAKIGTLEASTPLLDHKLPGSVYVAAPYANPFGGLLGIYLAVEDEQSGVVAKLAGRVTPDPATGRLTASFKDNPQLPLEDFDLHFFNGPRAALRTPLTCGTSTTTALLTPWSTPEGADVALADSFQTSAPASGAAGCPTSEAQAPHRPTFAAGATDPTAGAYSPFVLKISRPDGSQRLAGIETTLPRGLAARLAGVPYCSEAQIAAAKAREAPNQGAVEQANPSCPAASEIGTVTVGAGAGIAPLYVSGRAYLAGPYKGAPLSTVIITPAVAGPFDLGAVVVRAALFVDSETAQGKAVSDPLPTIIDGIPLDVRSVAVRLDRPNFTLNPTSCEPKTVLATTTSTLGQGASLSAPFQVGDCAALKFRPRLALSLKGGTKRTKNPAFKAVLTYPKGAYANIASAQVTLPHSEFLDQSSIGTVCTRVQFAADACPRWAIYGYARAYTPLLDKPVEGPLYLRSSSHELPDIVAALDGQIDVDVVGRVDTGKSGGIRNTFEAVPDAPVSKFVVELKGGKRKGLLVNSENICSKPQRAIANFTAQNGRVAHLRPLIANGCKKAKKKGAHKKKAHKKRR